ncbi:MAG TPA: bifunctional pyr operon transcriptional regulator/uracil phosphoribosyltransferase PyrR [Burkholderiales bacterium]|nr:bifunctional pyr operon transcriptional regulator/uracil phosphoribosyltransferase PyrR [Burkholderiales bacterium]
MTPPDAERLLAALAEQIRRDLKPETAIVGIYTGGVWLAQRLHEMFGLATPMGTIDVAFYRDDYRKTGLRTGVKPSDIPFPVEDAEIILVDDVLYTGRTIRAAMNEIFDYGRPRSIRLAALVDRGGRQLPICPQYVGAQVQVEGDELIELQRDESGRLVLRVTRRGE